MTQRCFDLLAALAALVVFAPLLLLLCVLQLCILGRPVFFRQERAGLGGRPFNMIKFRTMRTGAGDDAARLTRWGAFLRSTSLDELPELFHVVSGSMSLVGPRPLPVIYLNRYTPEQARRHETRPGITGWAQVNGRNTLTWEAQFEADLWYVENRSIWLDLRILFLTVGKVFRRDGISAEGCTTRGEFFGSTPAADPASPASPTSANYDRRSPP